MLLWQELRKRPGGYKFRKQHGTGNYVLDFYCVAAKLCIEVDGRAHDGERAAKRDAERSSYLRELGVVTTRIPASLVLSEIELVVQRIVQICDERLEKLAAHKPLHHASHGPPPPEGEDQPL